MTAEEYTALYTALWRPACAYICRQLDNSDHPDLEDIVGNVFARIFANSQRTTIENPHHYAWRTLRNGIIDYKRYQRRRHTIYLDHGSQYDDPDDDTREERLGLPTSPDPAAALMTPDPIDALHAALAQLTPNQRTAIQLYYLHDYPAATIAQHLGVSHGAAKAIIHRALVNLRRWLTTTTSNPLR